MKNSIVKINFVLICFFLLIAKSYGQEHLSIMGKWKVVTAKNENFYVDVKKDTIIVSEKILKNYPTAIGLQNERASIKMNHSHQVFIFTENNNFYEYLFLDAKRPMLEGNFKIIDNKIIHLNVFNISKTRVDKEATFYFRDDLLYLTMHKETNWPIEYVLEKIEN